MHGSSVNLFFVFFVVISGLIGYGVTGSVLCIIGFSFIAAYIIYLVERLP